MLSNTKHIAIHRWSFFILGCFLALNAPLLFSQPSISWVHEINDVYGKTAPVGIGTDTVGNVYSIPI